MQQCGWKKSNPLEQVITQVIIVITWLRDRVFGSLASSRSAKTNYFHLLLLLLLLNLLPTWLQD